jgi:hypothetical protein
MNISIFVRENFMTIRTLPQTIAKSAIPQVEFVLMVSTPKFGGADEQSKLSNGALLCILSDL